ncbi:hypothetical protein EVAR_90742_1 [Eumeta japonica]|uniref:Secreted protein n=1 Tax=Eumeta variegata TaxID=151549 RepID=A0A4C1ZS84_EUMVA|nr:hypothetical protein EVAR_90742_1 [Eumeta japonica]
MILKLSPFSIPVSVLLAMLMSLYIPNQTANRGNDMPSHVDSGGKKQQLRTRRRDSSGDILHESICLSVPPIPALRARLRIMPLPSLRRP